MIGHIPITQTEIEVQGDDLKQIHGIGPALERRFHEAGIYRYAQIAAMNSDELASYFTDLTGLSPRRIAEYDWIGQAQKLSETKAAALDDLESGLPENRLHCSVFTIELLLDGANRAQRTRVMHVQSHNEGVWEGWDEVRMAAFMAQNSGLVRTKSPREDLAALTHAQGEDPLPGGRLKLQPLEVISMIPDTLHAMIQSEKPFHVSLHLDLREMQSPPNSTFDCNVTLYARHMGSSKATVAGSAVNKVRASDDLVLLEVEGHGLPVGIYRLEALVVLTLPGMVAKPATDWMAMTESGTVQVY